jgi:hypothetical protein
VEPVRAQVREAALALVQGQGLVLGPVLGPEVED